jgi:curved DNA-binding protein CbpA
METYYTVLEIQDSATLEEVKEAYRLLLQVWHPDRFHHSPTLLAKAEQKSGKINVAFETLSDPELRRQYDSWLRASHGRSAKAVEPVTCPSCHANLRSAPEKQETWDAHQRKAAAAAVHDHESLSPAKTAMVAIAILFLVIIGFTMTKKSKVIISNKPAQTTETEPHSHTEPFAIEEDHAHQATDLHDSPSSSAARTDERETSLGKSPTAEPHQERLDRPELTQRLMAQPPGRTPASLEETISAVDLQQLKTLATQGNASAQNRLGQLYFNGQGVPQDYTMARAWYEKSAAQGNGWSKNQLGQMSADGLGVPQDYKKARQWWEQAAAQGIAQAQYNLGQLYANGRGVPQDYTMARAWYEKAALQRNAWAQAQLGQLYANGRGVPQDYTMARAWYEKSAAQGNAWAKAQLALL